jgi:hypothetical protein
MYCSNITARQGKDKFRAQVTKPTSLWHNRVLSYTDSATRKFNFIEDGVLGLHIKLSKAIFYCPYSGTLSLVSITEELLDRKVAAPV